MPIAFVCWYKNKLPYWNWQYSAMATSAKDAAKYSEVSTRDVDDHEFVPEKSQPSKSKKIVHTILWIVGVLAGILLLLGVVAIVHHAVFKTNTDNQVEGDEDLTNNNNATSIDANVDDEHIHHGSGDVGEIVDGAKEEEVDDDDDDENNGEMAARKIVFDVFEHSINNLSDPCVDFHNFSCPPTISTISEEDLVKQINYLIIDLLTESNDFNLTIARDLYKNCNDSQVASCVGQVQQRQEKELAKGLAGRFQLETKASETFNQIRSTFVKLVENSWIFEEMKKYFISKIQSFNFSIDFEKPFQTNSVHFDKKTSTISISVGDLLVVDDSKVEAIRFGKLGAILSQQMSIEILDQTNWIEAIKLDKSIGTTDYLTRRKCFQEGSPGSSGKSSNKGMLHFNTLLLSHEALKSAMGDGHLEEKPFGSHFTNEQIFFISLAKNWCEELAPKNRPSNQLINMPSFSQAFSCHFNSTAMCQLW